MADFNNDSLSVIDRSRQTQFDLKSLDLFRTREALKRYKDNSRDLFQEVLENFSEFSE